jgi:pimeloyl-ACP methyl ester carboxylesterase
VFAPTLTGVGERSHLLSSQITLDTHIDDIVNLIHWEELSNVVLCGHSYGGSVVSGVVDRIPDRIGAVVYLDAFLLDNGECVHDALPAAQRALQLELAQSVGDGWKVPPIPAEVLNVNPADREWVNRQCTMHPLATFQQPLKLSGVSARTIHTTFILATGFADSPFPPSCDRARVRGWTTLTIDCGHDVMLDRPDEVTRILTGAAAAAPAMI